MSGKYILRTAEDGYLTQKNISFAFLRCIGVSVDEFTAVKEIVILQYTNMYNNVRQRDENFNKEKLRKREREASIRFSDV